MAFWTVPLLFCSISYTACSSLQDVSTIRERSADAVTCNGLWSIDINGSCHCGVSVHDTVLCHQETREVKVLECYCMTPDTVNDLTVVGGCLYTCANGSRYGNGYALAPTDCSSLNRKGTLCGDCDKENHSFPCAYSYDIDCMKCLHPESWWRYIAEALVPLTVFIAIVIVCRVSVVSPKLRVFVLFSQMVATPINARPFILSVKHKSRLIDITVRIYMAIVGIWNLDFFRTLYPGVCLHLTELQVLALDYLVAVYPMILMVVAYIVVELHGYGFKPLLVIWRPFHAVFARFRRRWSIQTTIIDAFVTFFILSTTKFFSVSFDLLIPAVIRVASGDIPHHGYRLYYNANIVYMGQQHLPYALLAVACLILFVFLPLFLLLISSSTRFQESNWRVSVVGNFISCFQQYYKDGANGSPDRRWYASFYICVFFITYFTYAFVNGIFMYYLISIFAIIFAIFIMLVEPYKEDYAVYNYLESLLFLWIALFFMTLVMLDLAKNLQITFVMPAYLIFILVCMGPLVYLAVMFLHLLWKRCWNRFFCSNCQCRKTQLEESLPHRIACSVQYRD